MIFEKAQIASIGLSLGVGSGLLASMALIGQVDYNLLKSLDGLGAMGVLAFFAVQFFRANKELSEKFAATVNEIVKKNDERVERVFAEHRAEREVIVKQFNDELSKLIDIIFKQKP